MVASKTNILSKQSSKSDVTKDKILRVATRLFALKGYDCTSVKEISEAAAVNIAAVNYHYGSKEALYKSIIEGFGNMNLDGVRRVLKTPENQADFTVRLQMFIEETLDRYLDNPEVSKIVQREIEIKLARSEDVFRKTFLKRFDALVEFITEAKKIKVINKGIDPQFAAHMLFSLIVYQTRCDSVYSKFYKHSLYQKSYRKKWLSQMMKIFLQGITEK